MTDTSSWAAVRVSNMSVDAYEKWRGCTRKKQFEKKRALKTAKKWKLRAYECPHCGWWHTTKQKLNEKDY